MRPTASLFAAANVAERFVGKSRPADATAEAGAVNALEFGEHVADAVVAALAPQRYQFVRNGGVIFYMNPVVSGRHNLLALNFFKERKKKKLN